MDASVDRWHRATEIEAHKPGAAKRMPDEPANAGHDDAARAIRFLALKAGVYIGIPVIAAIVAVLVMLK